MHKRHIVSTSHDRPFTGPVSDHPNPAAHGNIVQIDRCRCGTERRTNINGRHIERGPWVFEAPTAGVDL